MAERKQVLLRLDPAIHSALAKWSADEFRSVNAQIDMLLRRALKDAGRLPKSAGPPATRGRPRTTDEDGKPIDPVDREAFELLAQYDREP